MYSDIIDETGTVSVVQISRHRRVRIRLVPAEGGRLNGAALCLELRDGPQAEWGWRFDLSLPVTALPALVDSMLECERQAIGLSWIPDVGAAA